MDLTEAFAKAQHIGGRAGMERTPGGPVDCRESEFSAVHGPRMTERAEARCPRPSMGSLVGP
jgi:hypothetical protein